jgi:hypothetical protein
MSYVLHEQIKVFNLRGKIRNILNFWQYKMIEQTCYLCLGSVKEDLKIMGIRNSRQHSQDWDKRRAIIKEDRVRDGLQGK